MRSSARGDATPTWSVLADARGATAEQGQWLIEDHVRLIAEAVRREFVLNGDEP